MNLQTLLLSPQGRIGRAAFWIGFALVMVLSVALNLIPGVIGHLLGFVLLWPQVCINAKRLHDMGRTGWLLLIPAGVSAACLLLSFVLGSGAEAAPRPQAMAPLVVAGLCGLAFLIWVGLARGTPGPNRFGAKP